MSIWFVEMYLLALDATFGSNRIRYLPKYCLFYYLQRGLEFDSLQEAKVPCQSAVKDDA